MEFHYNFILYHYFYLKFKLWFYEHIEVIPFFEHMPLD